MRRNEQDLASQPVRNTITNPAMVTKTSGTDTLLTNWIANPTFNFVGTSNTGAMGGGQASFTSSGVATDRYHSGANSYKLATCTVAGQAARKAFVNGNTLKVNKGQKISWSFWIYSTVAGTITPYWEGSKVSDGSYTGGGSSLGVVTVAANAWVYVTATSTLTFDSYVQGAGGYNLAVNVGDSVWFDDFCLTQTDAPVEYFDGDTPAANGYTYSWSGTPHNSSSIRKASSAIVRTNLVCNPTFKGGSLANIRTNNATNPSFRTNSGSTVEIRRNLSTNPSFETTSGTPTVRTNLITHPSFELNSGTVAVRTNYITNPGMETSGSAVVVRTNLAHDPRATASNETWGRMGWRTSRWFGGGSGAGTHTFVTGAGDGPVPGLTTYLRKTWTAAGTSNGDTGFDHSYSGVNGTPVSPLITYTVSSYLRATGVGKTGGNVQIIFYDASGVQVQSSSSTGVTMPSGAWVRLSHTAQAPSSAAFMTAISDVDTGTLWAPGEYLDGTGLLVEQTNITMPYFDGTTPAAVRTNLHPDPSFETGVGGWINNGPGTLAQDSTRAYIGTKSLKVVPGQENWGYHNPMTTGLVTPGQTYTFSVWVYSDAAQTLCLTNYNTPVLGPSVNVPAGVWTRLHLTQTIPANATSVWLSVRNPDRVTIPSTFYIDAYMIEQSSTLGTYFDGSSTPPVGYSYVWSGTAHNSASVARNNDFTHAWTGTVNVSSSEQRGVNVSGRTGLPPNGASWQSSIYSRTGTKSAAVLIKTNLADNASVWYPGPDFTVGTGAGQIPASTVVTWSVYVYIPTGSAAKVHLMEVTSAIRGTPSATLYDQWQRISMTFTTPASGTVFLRMRTEGTNPSGSTLWVDNEMIEAANSPSRYFDGSNPVQNLCVNPSFATGVTNYTSISASLARITTMGDGHVGELTQTVANAARQGAIYLSPTILKNDTYTVSFDVSGTAAEFTTVRSFLYDSVSATIVSASPTITMIKDGNFNRYTFNLTASASFDRIYLEVLGTNIPIGAKAWIDKVLVEQGTTASNPYYEGTGDLTHAWTGTADASSSTQSALNPSGWSSVGQKFISTLAPKYGTSCGAVATRGLNGDGLWPGTNLDVTAGRTYSFSAWVRVTSTHALTAGFRWYDASSVQIGSDFNVVITSQLVVGSWALVTATATAPANAVKLQMMLRIYETHTPTTFYMDGVILAESMVPVPYFDGSTAASGDFTYAWSGTVNASTSLQRGIGVTENAVLNAVPISSTEWKGIGTKSIRLVPHLTHITDSFTAISGDTGALRLGMIAGRTYTVSATIRLSAPLTGTLSSRSRKIVFFHKSPADQFHIETASAQAANVAGETRLSVTVTIPDTATEAFIRLYNGATAGNGDVWWDNLLVEEATALRPYFDGTVPAHDNLAKTAAVAASGITTHATDVAFGGSTWTRVTTTAGASQSLTRQYVDLSSLRNGEVYTTAVTVANDHPTVSVTLFFDWADTGSQSFVIAPGETRRIMTSSVRSTGYTDVYRFSDLHIAQHATESRSILFKDWLIELGTTSGEYYSGTGDFTYAWSGTANASTSVQRASAITGNLAGRSSGAGFIDSRHFTYQATDGTGKKMARWLSPSGTPSSNWRTINVQSLNYASIVAGSTYTIIMRYRSSGWGAGQTFAISMKDATAANVVIGDDTARALNTDWTEYRRTFTALINGLSTTTLYITLPLVPQATTNGIFDISEWALVEGTYNGPFFDGSTAASSSLSYAWSGTADASISYEKGTALTTGTYTVESKLATYVSSSATFIAYVKEPNGAGGRSFVPASAAGQLITFTSGKKYTVKMRGRKFNSATGYRFAGAITQEMPLTTSMATHTVTFTATTTSVLYIEHPSGSNDAGTEWEYLGIYEEGDPIAYFDGDTSGFDGLIHRWTGTPNASQSEQIGAAVTALTNEALVRRWALPDGAMRVINISGVANSVFTSAGSTTEGRTHTVLFRAKLYGSLTTMRIYGLNNAPSFTLSSSYAWYRATGVATSNRLWLSTDTAPAGSGYDISHLMVVEGTYTGGYVDGNSYGALWEGTAHAATSLGNPTSLESIAGKPLYTGTAAGNFVLSSSGVPENSARTLYTIIDNILDLPSGLLDVVLAYGSTALNDTIPNKYLTIRQQSVAGQTNSNLVRRTGGGGPQALGVPSSGRQILIGGINGDGYLFSGFNKSALVVDNLLVSMPHERIIIDPNTAYHNHVITYVYAGFHNDAMRAEMIKLLALKHNVTL